MKITILELRALASVGAVALGREDIAIELLHNRITIHEESTINNGTTESDPKQPQIVDGAISAP